MPETSKTGYGINRDNFNGLLPSANPFTRRYTSQKLLFYRVYRLTKTKRFGKRQRLFKFKNCS